MRGAIAVLIGSVLLVGGCTSVDRERLHVLSLARHGAAEARACMAAIEAKPRYARMYEKLAVAIGDDPSDRQLDDSERPTDSDIALGLAWYAEAEGCQRLTIEWEGRIDPDLAVIGAEQASETTRMVMEIVKARPSFGEMNHQILALRERQKAAVQQWAATLRRKLALEAAQEEHEKQRLTAAVGFVADTAVTTLKASLLILVARQQAVIAAQQAYATQAPSYVAAPITTTQCHWAGNLWMCTQF